MSLSRLLLFLTAFLLVSSIDKAALGDESPLKISNNVCEITGVVSKLEEVARSPWADGTPTADLNSLETAISVKVNDRKPHYRDTPSDSVCNRGARGEVLTYKLCSSTPVKAGDQIHATEGFRTGPGTLPACLFDIEKLPKKAG